MRRLGILVALLTAGCASEGAYPPERLSEWGLFADGAAQTPAEGVVPYEVISPLFSDYAAKHRFIRLPEGERIAYTAEGDWVYPNGTVLVKTFGFLHDLGDPSQGERLIETRLLVLEDGAWRPYVYLWDNAQRDAELKPIGARVDVAWTHLDGAPREATYRVPNVVECVNCHGGNEAATPIGPRTAQMDLEYDYGAGLVNQIDHLDAIGWMAGEVQPQAERVRLADPFGAGDLEARARAYLDANCAHCHHERGAAGQSGLWLGAEVTQSLQLGICKRPVAAGRATGGRTYDIVPGAPDESVLVFRMESLEPGIKMPETGVVTHDEGVALIREWIAAMPARVCD